MAERLPTGYIEPPAERDMGWFRDLGLLLGGIVAAVIAVYIAVGWAAEWIVTSIPVATEEKFWKAIEPDPVTLAPSDPVLKAHYDMANTVLGKLDVASLQLPYVIRIMIRDDAEPNAFAMPGGRLVLTRGLFDAVKSENGLAFVIGHELGHFQNRDHLRGLGRKVVIWSLAILFTGDVSTVSQMISAGFDSIDLKYSRDQESSADAVGLALLVKAYGHAGGATELFEHLKEKHPELRFFAIFSTHPSPAQRIMDIRSTMREKGYREEAPVPLAVPVH